LVDQRCEDVAMTQIGRWAPLALIAVGIGVVLANGWHRYLSLETLQLHRAALLEAVAQAPVIAPLIFMGVYFLASLLGVPGVLWLTIAGGFLFGTWVGGAAAWAGALIGASALFMAARGARAPLLQPQTK
jgi:uncharacterized membrane protein YdjX (TVP38/TMEM64 family)